jgi:hypothetical protein
LTEGQPTRTYIEVDGWIRERAVGRGVSKRSRRDEAKESKGREEIGLGVRLFEDENKI